MKHTNLKSIMAPMLAIALVFALLPNGVQAASKPKLNKKKITVYVGQSTTLKVKGASGKVAWSTKNKKIAKVSKAGKIIGKKAGTTAITARINKKTLKCKVTVKNPFLNAKRKTLEINQKFQLKLTGGKIKSCTSSDKTIATVTEKGQVTARKVGNAVIFVKETKGKKYKCTITVKGRSSSDKNPSEDNSPSGNNPAYKFPFGNDPAYKFPSGNDPADKFPSGNDPSDNNPSGNDPSENNPSGNDPSNNNPSGNQPSDGSQPKDLAEANLQVSITNGHSYTGKPIEPEIWIFDDNVYLQKDIDYTVSYANNVNAGKAQLTISGIGKYKGNITKEFEIAKASQYIAIDMPKKVYVGKTGKIEISGEHCDNLEFEITPEGIAQVDRDGTITGLKTGLVNISITAKGDENHYEYKPDNYNRVQVIQEEASAYGFPVNIQSTGDKRYKDRGASGYVENDGTIAYDTVRFDCNSDANWLKDVTFQVEDVTPKAYKTMFQDMGVDCSTPTFTVRTEEDMLTYYLGNVKEPITTGREGSTDEPVCSSQFIDIKTGAGTRALKVTARKNGVLLDEVYLGCRDKKDGEYSAFSLDLYRRVRERIEAQIWTEEMSNLEKIKAMAKYINETTHYPRTELTSKEDNPTFWEDWSVDGIDLQYNMYNDVILNRTMCLQGGIVTCLAAEILTRVAQEDLGLPYLYSNTGEIALGEGVWEASGSYSSNPWNPSHVSLVYKDANEQKTLIDAQGMDLYSSGNRARCEDHGCKEKILSLKERK